MEQFQIGVLNIKRTLIIAYNNPNWYFHYSNCLLDHAAIYSLYVLSIMTVVIIMFQKKKKFIMPGNTVGFYVRKY